MARTFKSRPAYAGTNLPLASEVAPNTHVGAGGTSEHPAATTSVAGFMSAADKTKSDKFDANTYAWYAYQNTQQLNIVSATITKLNYETVVGTYNGGGNYSTTTSRFTAPVAGWYDIRGGYQITPAVTAKNVRLYLTINAGAASLIIGSHQTNGTTQTGVYGSILYSLAAADTVELSCYHDFAVNTSDIVVGQANTWFQGLFVRSI